MPIAGEIMNDLSGSRVVLTRSPVTGFSRGSFSGNSGIVLQFASLFCTFGDTCSFNSYTDNVISYVFAISATLTGTILAAAIAKFRNGDDPLCGL